MNGKIIFLVVLIIMATAFGASANASPCVCVNDVFAKAGETVEVAVSLSEDVSFSNLGIEIGYDSEVFTLEGVTECDFGALYTKAPSYDKNPYNMSWDSAESTIASGTLAILEFKISNDAQEGTYPVTVSYYKGREGEWEDGVDINYDGNSNSLNLSYQNGSITVKSEKDRVFVTNVSYENGVSFNVDVTTSEIGGHVLAVLYDSRGAVVSKKICPASEVSAFSFTESGSLIKIMWWDLENMIPVSKHEKIEL